jgi:hypothetical protein
MTAGTNGAQNCSCPSIQLTCMQDIASLKSEVSSNQEKQACCEASSLQATKAVQAQEAAIATFDLDSCKHQLLEADSNIVHLKASVTKARQVYSVKLLNYFLSIQSIGVIVSLKPDTPQLMQDSTLHWQQQQFQHAVSTNMVIHSSIAFNLRH